MTALRANSGHRIQEQFARVAALLRRTEAECAQAGPDGAQAALARRRPTMLAAMHALGSAIDRFLGSRPAQHEIEAARQLVVPPIRDWSAGGPFFDHAFRKPRGYPGDFETIEIIYDCRSSGEGLPSLIFDDYYLHARPAQAVRNRLIWLADRLEAEVREQAGARGRPVRVLSLGSGPARELALLSQRPGFAEATAATCLDLDPAALAFTRGRLDGRMDGRMQFVRDNALRFAAGPNRPDQPYDLIYAAGLFDYLNAGQAARLITDCHGLLAAGGLLIIGNFSHETHPSDRILMDWLLEWRLIYRDEAEYRAIFVQTPFGSNGLRFEYEALRANLFVLAARP